MLSISNPRNGTEEAYETGSYSEKKEKDIEAMVEKQNGTAGGRGFGLFHYSTVASVCIHLSAVWGDGEIQFL